MRRARDEIRNRVRSLLDEILPTEVDASPAVVTMEDQTPLMLL